MKRVLASLWAAVTDPVMWRLAVGAGLLIPSLALAYVPGLVADQAPTHTVDVTNEHLDCTAGRGQIERCIR